MVYGFAGGVGLWLKLRRNYGRAKIFDENFEFFHQNYSSKDYAFGVVKCKMKPCASEMILYL